MLFMLLLLLSLIVGILACMPLAHYISPPTSSLLIILFAPWVALNMFSQNSIVSDIRYIYLSFIIGMCIYWTYFEVIKKLNSNKS